MFEVIKDYVIEEEIDLHGLSIEEALYFAEKFLHESLLQGKSCIKIIHGARRLGGTRGTIRENLYRLFKTKLKRSIAHFQMAKFSEGGSGATVLFIKKIESKRRIP